MAILVSSTSGLNMVLTKLPNRYKNISAILFHQDYLKISIQRAGRTHYKCNRPDGISVWLVGISSK